MQVAKWGNSLAVRLPAIVVEALGLKEGDEIEIHVADGRRCFRPIHFAEGRFFVQVSSTNAAAGARRWHHPRINTARFADSRFDILFLA